VLGVIGADSTYAAPLTEHSDQPTRVVSARTCTESARRRPSYRFSASALKPTGVLCTPEIVLIAASGRGTCTAVLE
jgi:hypothetical protein